MSRIAGRFAALAAERRAGLITFVTGGDPDFDRSLAILAGLPAAGADLIEVGMAFTDPMADGPAIQAANLRALAQGATLTRTLDLVRRFRVGDDATPIVLMGYFNPIHAYGIERFVADAVAAGVDGLIVVDVPPEEDAPLGIPARAAGLDVIRLATPTTDDARLPVVLENATGFLYYVSIAGITGSAAPDVSAVATQLRRLRRTCLLPIAVGFGIRDAGQAAAIAGVAEAAVVGSALVTAIADAEAKGEDPVAAVHALVAALAAGVRGVRRLITEDAR